MIKRWLILITLGLFFFMVIIDGTIVVVAVPTIASALAVSPSQVNLLLTVYLTTISVCLLFFGQLADQYGRTRLFIWGTYLFLIGSGLAGFGVNFQLILAARVVQAVGASMTMATSYAIVADVFPPAILGRALGIESIFISAGALAGPGIGGLILSQLPWGYIFWVNLPIGVVCLLVEWAVFPRTHAFSGKKSVDGRGFLQLIVIGGLLLLIQINKQPLFTGILVILIGTCTYWFWRHERQTDQAMLDTRLFSNQLFSRNLAASFLNYVAAYFFTLLAPIYLQLMLRLPVALSGYLLMLTPLVSLAANPVAGVLSDRFDRQRLMRIGLLMLVLTNVAFALLPHQTTTWPFVIVSVAFAVGTALFTNPNSVVLMQSVDATMRGQVGAATSLARQLGMSIGSAIAGLVFYQTLGIVSPYTTAVHAAPQALFVAQGVSFMLAAALFFIAVMLLRKKVENAKRTG
ncbi:Transporter, major facilitator superfamily MFS_1, EmrB/QacA family protein [Lacticaseibacillus paracasei subsp. paracasei Lpp125]|uniref:MFS transporter n=1 Tax=Lacticaseibacillus paracasei TaxID=1597 RepID=UPI0003434279|nr:MFS transporter [Lacticaseibacillus paracasei]EPC99325.1 Transporter, major facilitator superfamily MFS_1, EmrB/QacA family protein [Lacticaseibacillus paracasei subsp. paracasei Lpp125]